MFIRVRVIVGIEIMERGARAVMGRKAGEPPRVYVTGLSG